jgi:carbonic anhydrase
MQAATADEWGYRGDLGPEHWASLDDANVLCAEGRAQSPLDLVATISDTGEEIDRVFDEPVLDVSDRAHVMDLIDNGHTIQVTSDAAVAMRINGEPYELVQFHFHGPSEHTLAGRHFPIESHFVMASESGELAVLGVFYKEGAHDPEFDPILAALPEGPGDKRHLEDLDLELEDLKPLPKHYFRYDGSLTTPPCSEGVKWIVMADPQPLSAEQIGALDAHLHGNNRPVQPQHGRHVVLIRPNESDLSETSEK